MSDDELTSVATFSQPSCICCGSAGHLIHTQLIDRLFSAPGKWNIRQCAGSDCGLAWLDPQPARRDIGKLYRNYWTHGSTETPIPAPDPQISPRWKRNLRVMLSMFLPWRFYALRSDCRYISDCPPSAFNRQAGRIK